MSKDLDLDFKEMAPPKTVVKELSKDEKGQPPKLDNAKPLNISIALEPEPGKVVLKDLAELTGEEFLMWAARVFPVLDQSAANPRDFDTRQDKARAFEQILRFHSNSIFHTKKTEGKPH